MATDRIKGITIQIGADTTKLNEALKDVDKNISQTRKSLADVDKLLKVDPSNVELLGQKMALLKTQISDSTSRLNTLQLAEQQLKDAGIDETSEQFMGLRREIIANESSINRLNAEMDKTQKELDDASKSAKKSGKEIKKEGQETDKSGKKHKTANKQFSDTSIKLAAIVSVAKTAIEAIKKVATAIINIGVEASNSAGELKDLSDITGINVEELQRLQYAGTQVGVEISTMASLIKKNTQSMKQASEMNYETMEAYELLGVTIYNTDGTLRNSNEVFLDVIDALASYEEGTERDILATTLLGKSASELNPLLKAGTEELEMWKNQADELGIVLGQDSVNALDNYSHEIDKLKAVFTSMKNSIALEFLPIFENVTSKLVNWVQEIKGVIKGEIEADKLIQDIFGDGDQFVKDLVEFLAKLIDKLIPSIPTIFRELSDSISDIISEIMIQSIPLAFDLIANSPEILLSFVEGITSIIPKITIRIAEQLKDFIVGFITDDSYREAFEVKAKNLGITFVNGIIDGLNTFKTIDLPEWARWLLTFLGFPMAMAMDGKAIPKLQYQSYENLPLGNNFMNSILTQNSGSVQSQQPVVQQSSNGSNGYNKVETYPNINIRFEGSLGELARVLEPEITFEQIRKE